MIPLHSRPTGPSLAAMFLTLSLATHAVGQSSVASSNNLHAIVGARIEIGDGHSIPKGTIVIRDGLIVSVAPDAAVPKGAEILDGKGLVIYPGFIDCYSIKGYTAPTVAGRPAVADPNSDNPNYASAFMRDTVRPSIHPEASAVQGLNLADDLLKGYQESGFTTVLFAPSGGDINGTACLANLSGRPTRECVVNSQVCQAFSLGGGAWGDAYPSSLLGHIAQMRQALLDAQWYAARKKAFEAGDGHRPPSDESLIALQAPLTGSLPVLFEASNAAQIGRALGICSEFGLKPILAGVTEGWKQVSSLKGDGVKTIVAFTFGAEPGAKAEKSDKAEKPQEKDAGAPELSVNPAKVAERKRLYNETVSNASALVAAGIPFGFTTKGAPSVSGFMENLRKAVKAGLSKEAALKALTIDGARLLGADRLLGTIEVGKVANLVCATTDFTDPQMKVKMLYIDGRKIDPSRGKAVPPAGRFPFGHEEGR